MVQALGLAGRVAMLLLAAVLPLAAQAAPGSGNAILFEGALLITGSGESIENSAFLVEDGQFTQVGRRGEVNAPAGAMRVDLTGKSVIPGLVDLHTHVGYERYTGVDGAPLPPEMTGRIGVLDGWGRGVFNLGAHNFTRENILDHLNRFAYHGVAAAWSAGYEFGDTPFDIRDEVNAGEHPNAARYLPAGPGFLPASDLGPSRGRQSGNGVATEEEARTAVRKLAAKNVEMIKLWNERMPVPIIRALIDEAHSHGIRVAAHPGPETSDLKEMLRAGLDVLVHPIDCPANECAPRLRGDAERDMELVDVVRERSQPGSRPLYGILASATSKWMFHSPYFETPDPLLRATVAPSQLEELRSMYGTAAQRSAEGSVVSAEQAEAWDRTVETMKEFRAAGLRLGMGSDAGGAGRNKPVGFFAHVDLENLVSLGLTPMEAIVAGTKTSAEAVGLDELGGVAPGKEASFVVLDANPLVDITNTREIDSVYLRGNKVDREGLEEEWAESWGGSR